MAAPRLVLALALVAPWALPAVAAANPAVEACQGKSEGEACGLVKLVKPPGGGELQRKTVPGVCRPDECCDLDYSKGSPPETTCHACLACKEGPGAPGETPPPDDAKPGAGDQGEPPRTEDGPPAPAPTEQRGCTVGGAPRGATASLLGLLGLLLVGRRRRR
ncbi:MAG: hypothetical protein H6712_00040 [Myxococcales bacterium]|nr:hypothetical protein [Myxococcales bacterium]MCB9712213.1 hypothetical protein [Myxococcales bacterium]